MRSDIPDQAPATRGGLLKRTGPLRVAALALAALALTTFAGCNGDDAAAPAQSTTPRTSATAPETPRTPEPTPFPISAIYFAATPKSASPWLSPTVDNDIYLRRGLEPKRRIISTDADERCPAVSPDGTRLAYLTGPYDVGGVLPAKVVVVPLDSAGDPELGSRRVVLRNALGESPGTASACPEWSPDGRRLAVATEGEDWTASELHVVTPGGKDRILALGSEYLRFAWSPDGDAVAYLTEDAVWIAPLDGGEPELFWRSTPTPDPDPNGIPLPGSPTSVQWLSTGELAVVVRSDHVSDGWPYVPEGPNVLHIVDVQSGRHEKIGRIGRIGEPDRGVTGELARDVVWSPDDSRFAIAKPDGHHILVRDRASRSTVTLRPKLDGIIAYVTWSPDGDRLLVGVQKGSDSSGPIFALLSVAPDGTSVEVIAPWTDTLYPR